MMYFRTLSIFSLLAFLSNPMLSQSLVHYDKNGESVLICGDTISIPYYSIVESGINHHMFLVQDSNYVVGRKNKRYWKDDRFFIFWQDYETILWYCRYDGDGPATAAMWDKMWAWGDCVRLFYKYGAHKKDIKCQLVVETQPTLFQMFYIREDVFNEVFSGLDALPNPINFRNSKKYRSVYCPIRKM